MSDPDRLEDVVAPLFDRLRTTKSAAEPQPLTTLSRRELHESIRRELSGLLNVRSPLSADRYCSQPLTVLDYGIPDLTSLSTRNGDDAKRLSRFVARAIAAFEPRLEAVEVTVTPLDDQSELLLTCKGRLAGDQLGEALYLTVVIPNHGGTGQVLHVELPPEL
ncbi:MAG TPA: type VI secretion system baseplate subunit TssE [Herpetosiphonaceae bacterium]